MIETTTMRSKDDVYTYQQQALDLLEIRRIEGDISYDNYVECKRLLQEQIADELETLYRAD